MTKKKGIIIGAAIALVALVVIITCLLLLNNKNKEEIVSWDKYLSNYEDKTVDASTDSENYYAKEFILRDKKLYAVSNDNSNEKTTEIDGKKAKFVMSGIREVYVIKYNEMQYVYIVNVDGKTLYLNNLKYSTASKYELTELGDYSFIEKMEVKDNKIIAVNKDKEKLDLSKKIVNYTAYSG